MSRTYHHKGSYKDSKRRMEKGWLSPYYYKHYYSKSPKWFIREFNTAPKRAETRNLLAKQKLDIEKDLIYPDKKKPIIYYH